LVRAPGPADIENLAELRENFGWAMVAIHVPETPEVSWHVYLPLVVRDHRP
jgi:hypothetical protein